MITALIVLGTSLVYLLASAPTMYWGERLRIRDYRACSACRNQTAYSPSYHEHRIALWGYWGLIMVFWPIALGYYACSEFTNVVIDYAQREKKVVLVKRPNLFTRLFGRESD